MLSQTVATGGASIGDAVSGIFDIAGEAISMITGNPLLLTFFCASLVGVGIGVVKKLKR